MDNITVRVIKDVPVGMEHGIKKGRKFTARVEQGRRSRDLPSVRGENSDSYWVMGNAGKEVKLWSYEVEIVK